MIDHDFPDEEIRALDRAAEDYGAEALPAIESMIDRLTKEGKAAQVDWLLPAQARGLALRRRFDDAEAAAESAYANFRRRGSARGQVLALNAQAVVSMVMGRLGYGLDATSKAAGLALELGDPSLQVRVANSRGSTLIYLGRLQEAVEVLEDGFRVSTNANDEPASLRIRANLSVALARLAIQARDRDLPESSWRPKAARAIELAEPVISLWRSRGRLGHAATTTGSGLALAYVALDRLTEAHAALDQAESALQDDLRGYAIVPLHGVRARAHLQANDMQLALEAIERAIAAAEIRPNESGKDEIYRLKSLIHERRGESLAALAAYKEFHELREKFVLDRIERSRSEARHDALTGLANRRRFDEYIGGVLPRASQEYPVTLLLFDLDHFKSINDRHSHIVGDAALRWVASQLETHCRQTDLPVRLGGDEFALVVEAPIDAALQLFARVRVGVAERSHDLPAEVVVTLSGGIAEATSPCSAVELIARADKALYEAKAAGRDRAHIATSAARD